MVKAAFKVFGGMLLSLLQSQQSSIFDSKLTFVCIVQFGFDILKLKIVYCSDQCNMCHFKA